MSNEKGFWNQIQDLRGFKHRLFCWVVNFRTIKEIILKHHLLCTRHTTTPLPKEKENMWPLILILFNNNYISWRANCSVAVVDWCIWSLVWGEVRYKGKNKQSFMVTFSAILLIAFQFLDLSEDTYNHFPPSKLDPNDTSLRGTWRWGISLKRYYINVWHWDFEKLIKALLID